jgi:hypothetical protein
MTYIEEIKSFNPQNEQEASDKEIILNYIYKNSSDIFLRDNKIAI